MVQSNFFFVALSFRLAPYQLCEFWQVLVPMSQSLLLNKRQNDYSIGPRISAKIT